MGQVIQLRGGSPDYPDAAAELDTAECVFLVAIRWWVTDFRHSNDPLPRLSQALENAGAHDAAFSIDQLMALIARSARRSIAIHHPRCPGLADDEKLLLQAASLAQADKPDRVEYVLRTTLVSAEGAEFARGPLEGLGALFAAARLRFRRRRSLLTHYSEPARVEPWQPHATLGTRH